MTKILIIEDQPDVRENIQAILDLEDYETLTAADGLIGVELAQQFLPDLILCDVMMPRLDGFGVLKELRQLPATGSIPFIFLTAKADRTDLRHGMESGADDYLTKPFTLEELLNAIAVRLARQVTVNQAAHQEMNQLRQNITRALPHELLTPLNGILGRFLRFDEQGGNPIFNQGYSGFGQKTLSPCPKFPPFCRITTIRGKS
jgi:DNA-binding response OmpR family regulator